MSEGPQFDAIVIDASDNVATALRSLQPGEEARIRTPTGSLTCLIREPIPLCHKFALKDLAAGDHIVKYGAVIGRLTARVAAGSHIHVHNIESRRARR